MCDECGVKKPHEVKQMLFTKKHITEIEDLGLSSFLPLFAVFPGPEVESQATGLQVRKSHLTLTLTQFLTLNLILTVAVTVTLITGKKTTMAKRRYI